MRPEGTGMAEGGAGIPALPAVGALLLTAVPGELAAQTETGIFSLNLGLTIWTWVLFGLTLLVLWRFAFPAIAGGLERRQAGIQGAIDQARSARDEARAALATQEQTLEAARREARDILEQARSTADGIRKEMVEEARAQQSQMIEDARREIGLERDRLRQEIRHDAVDLALAASERLIRARLDEDENRRLVRDFVSSV